MAFALNRMLKPQSVALIGASADPASISGLVARSVLAQLDASALPKIYLINPHHEVLYGHACLKDINALPLGVDLVIILTPWAATPDCLEALAAHDIGGVVCISIATESSIAGILWQSRKSLLAKLRRQLTRLNLGMIGPSSFGIQLPHLALNASLIPVLTRAGGVAVISHSEAVAGIAAEYCAEQGLGIRALVTLGDAININAAELLDYFAKDANTTTVLLELPHCAVETPELMTEFLSALRACAQRKATVVWLNPHDLDNSESNIKARADRDILRQGALVVRNLESFCEAAHLKQYAGVTIPLHAQQKLLLTGNSAALLSLCVEATLASEFELASLPAPLIRRLRPLLAARSSIVNPLDLGRDANPTRYMQVAHELASFSSALMFCHHPNAFSDGHAIAEALCSEASFTLSNADQLRIAIFTGHAQAPARLLLRAHGFAAFDAPETAMRSLAMRARLHEIRAAAKIQAPPQEVELDAESGTELGAELDAGFPSQIVISASGIRMVLRGIQAADEAELQRGFLRLSPEEVRMRFMYPLKALTHDLAVRLTQLDPNRDIALVLAAPAPVGEAQIYAVVRASRTPSYRHRLRTDAEFAIVIPRALSGQGLGKKLMLELIRRCQQLGIRSLWGDVLADNAAMLALARKLEFDVQKHPDRDFGGGNLVRVVRAI